MNDQEKERIDRITEVVHYLLKGMTPEPILCENDPDDEIRQLSEKTNELIHNIKEIKSVIIPLSQGNLNIELPRQNILASPFKQLHSSLRHLTWQTQCIARGDFNQHVDFMGDFSIAFNSMVEALKDARSQLISEIDRFKHLAEIKEHYLNVMAHDIRTPISAVIGFSDILLEENLSAEQKNYVKIIRRSSESLLMLINNILDMAKLERHKVELVSVPFSIRMLVEDIGIIIQPKLNKGVQFIVDIDENIPEKIEGDSYRLQQILNNLVGNSIKFTSKGAVKLKIRMDKIDTINITGLNAGDELKLYFSVEDTGIGIAKDKLENIFNAFTQADASITSRFGGTGLGLSIARELTSLMGGELKVKSRVGKGSIFYFSLPFRIAEKTKPEQSAEVKPCSSCNILVVDDDPNSLQFIENILKKKKIFFMLCDDSTKAYDLIIRAYETKKPFTLACIDIDMPELNGFDLAKKIRQDNRLKNLRLIACTAYKNKIQDATYPSHFSFIVTKPISAKAFKRIIEEADINYPSINDKKDLSGIRLLIVDDNPINRFLIVNILSDLKMEITEAENGLEAVNKISEQSFDVVLMDKQMPVMDGLEAIHRIRETHDKNTLPILAFTADDSLDKENLISAGVNGFVSKPIAYEDIVDKLYQTVKEWK